MASEQLIAIAQQLFSVSPLKQRKLAMLERMMDDPNGKRSLDLGSDNGVISRLLRRKGGEWSSADLIPETVEAIRALVDERVFQVSEQGLPFAECQFDQVLVVDMLEHLHDDGRCVQELARILKPGGVLVVNVPNPREGLFRRLRFALGQTDQAHGHVRPGYTLPKLDELLRPYFSIESSQSYGRFFSELIDTIIVGALDLLKGGSRGKKGKVITSGDISKMQKSFALYRAISPILRFFMLLDGLIPFAHGNMLIVRAIRKRD